MSKYRKFVVAVAGVVVAFLGRRWGVDSPAYADVVAVVTALGVYAIPNGGRP